MLHDVERDHMIQLSQMKQLQQVATAIWPHWDPDGAMFKDHYNRGNEHLVEAGRRLMPYAKWNREEAYKSEIEQLRAEYIKRFGDPSTPEAKAQAERDRQAVRRRKVESRQQAAAAAAEEAERARKLRELRERRYNRRR